MGVKLRLTGRQHATLQNHLFPGDGLEAVAIALCGRRDGADEQILCVQKLIPVPHGECERKPNYVRWRTEFLEPLLLEAERRHLGVLKVHSHTSDYDRFSDLDDAADKELFSSIHGWVDDELPHASAVMLPGGTMFGRTVSATGHFTPLSLIAVAGDDIHYWFTIGSGHRFAAGDVRNVQAFGEGTISLIKGLSVAVVGCSGTGSPIVEALARFGPRRLLLVDPGCIGYKNLNRILNATAEDAALGRPKVEVLARAVSRIGFGTEVVPIQKNLADAETIRMVAGCDVVFGGMDGAEGRYLLNRLASFYSIPYFDVGIRLDADGRGGIDQAVGTVHYLQPDGSSLLSRRVIAMDEVSAEGLHRTNPSEYARRRREGYIHGLAVDRPAVNCLNMHFASLAVCEFLARIHPFRADPNGRFAVNGYSFVNDDRHTAADGTPCPVLSKLAGRGDVLPLLDMPSLG